MNIFGKILEKLIRDSKRSREWRYFVFCLAAVVVFTTTYALILPAITVEKDTTDSVGGLVTEEADPGSMGAGAENPEDVHTVTAGNKKSDEAVQKETVPEEAAGNTEAAEEEREPYNGEVLTIGDRYIMTLTGEEFDVVVSSDLSAGVSRGTTLSVRGIPDPDVAKSYSDRISDELLKSFVDTKSTEILYQLVFTDEDFFEYTPTGRFDVEFIFHNNTVGSDGEMIYAPRFDGGKVYAAIYDYLTDEMILAEKNGDEYETPVILLDENGVLRSITLKGLDFYEYSDVITLVGGPVNEELKLAAETAESSGKTKSEESSEEAKKSPEKKETGSGTLNARGSDYSVTLAYSAEAEIPDNAVLEVTEIGTGTDVYMQYLEQAKAALGLDKDQALPQEQARFFDIRIMVDGKEIQPAANVNVNIAYDAPVVGSDPRTDSQVDVSAVHFGKEGAEVVEVGDADDRSVKFEAESFSIYGVIYTVDFEYEVDGKTYKFSLPGGGFVSFANLVEVLGIIGDTNTEDNGDENRAAIVENTEENPASEEAEENGVSSNTNTALTLDNVEVSDATRKFVADVESVEFSSPELVDVSKVENETTVGQIKESRGLECQYSAELTEEQIAEINAQTVEAGDWALISMQPFASEESLTVTMKNGEVFSILVTDAQRIYKSVDDVETGDYLIYSTSSETINGVKYTIYRFLKNDGTTVIKKTASNEFISASELADYTWHFTKINDNGVFTIKSTKSNTYLTLPGNNATTSLTGSSSAYMKLKQVTNSEGYDSNIKIYNYDETKWINWSSSSGFIVSTSGSASLNLFKIESSSSGGGASGIVLDQDDKDELDTWKETLERFDTLTSKDKIAEVYNYDNRIYKIDITADSGITDFYKDVDLGFVLDVSNSMNFPSSLSGLCSAWMSASDLDDAKSQYSQYYSIDDCFYVNDLLI